jgi:hypothetical protein
LGSDQPAQPTLEQGEFLDLLAYRGELGLSRPDDGGEFPEPEAEQNRHRDLIAAGDEGDPFHPEQIIQRELDAEREHQEANAEIREEVDPFGSGDWSRRIGADHHTGEEEPDDGHEPDALGHPSGQRGADDDDGEGRDELRYVAGGVERREGRDRRRHGR